MAGGPSAPPSAASRRLEQASLGVDVDQLERAAVRVAGLLSSPEPFDERERRNRQLRADGARILAHAIEVRLSIRGWSS